MEDLARLALVSLFRCYATSDSLFNNILEMLLHAQHVMPSNDYICHVQMVQTLALKGNSVYLSDDPRTFTINCVTTGIRNMQIVEYVFALFVANNV